MANDWIDPVPVQERERLRSHAGGRPLMRQVWRHLLFAHFPIHPAELAHLIPEGLDLDLFPDASGTPMAWLGLVPFATEHIRAFGAPPLPGLAAFDEINVRTYVHRQGQDPSVLFLSLDGGPWPIRATAWAYYKVPYARSATSLRTESGLCTFTSDRRRTDQLGTSRIVYRPGQELPLLEPGTLEYFLLERYQILAPANERIYRSRIFHAPYRVREVEVETLETNLPEVHGIRTRPFIHFLYSDEVRTQFFASSRIS